MPAVPSVAMIAVAVVAAIVVVAIIISTFVFCRYFMLSEKFDGSLQLL